MRMRELAGLRRLGHELHGRCPVEIRTLHDFGMQHFQCNVASRERVEGEIDCARCALTEHLSELEFPDLIHAAVIPLIAPRVWGRTYLFVFCRARLFYLVERSPDNCVNPTLTRERPLSPGNSRWRAATSGRLADRITTNSQKKDARQGNMPDIAAYPGVRETELC